LILTIPSLVAQVLDDIPKAFSLAEDGVHRKDVPLVPRKVIREAIVNALMHRNYQKHQPVQIIRYANRIEIKNPGYSLVPEERLGEPGSITRNPKIAAVLHDIGLAETKGTGIRAMREAMERANLTLPLFESDRARDEFTVRLLVHHLLTPQDWDWLGRFRDCNLDEDDARALIIVREIGAIDNAMYRSATHLDALTASGHLRKLRDHGLLEKRGSGSATYYVPAARLLGKGPEISGVEAEPTSVVGSPRQDASWMAGLNPPGKSLLSALNPPTKGLVTGLNPATKAEQLGIGPLPPPLAQSILELGDRADPMALRQVIVELCRWKALQPSHLAGLLNRGPKYLRSKCLRPMILSGELEYLHPTNPAHPKQAYRATSIREEKEDARENN
jgi:ATP-dependent DNA helicase RecG